MKWKLKKLVASYLKNFLNFANFKNKRSLQKFY